VVVKRIPRKPFLSKNPIITILGGEPLMDIDKLISVSEQAIRLKFTVLVSTNGIKITDDFARKAAKLGIQVQVSLDGHNAVLHDSIRGKGTFEGAVEGVRTLVRNQVHTIISMVCHQGNIDFLKDFYSFAHELGVNEARFIPLKCMGGAVNSDYKPVPLNELLNNAFILFKKYPEFLSLTGRDAFSIQANTCKYSLRRASCGTGLQTILLDADGSLYPCLNTNNPLFRIANISDFNFDFQEIWVNSSVLNNVRKQSNLFEPEEDHENCPVRYWCLGGCRGENHTLTGELAKRPPHCAELKRSIIDMFWMLAERPDIIKESVKTC
jgi:radical SAM protein with 4Fe4S-binding SPASM domain